MAALPDPSPPAGASPPLTPGPTAITSAPTGNDGSLASRLAASMAWRWQQGERPLAEEYLARHPELLALPEEAFGLIYEEICLRREHDRVEASAALLERFPQWRTQLEVLLACHQLFEPAAPPEFPEAGQTLGDFHLLAELGRGGQGRVFLASQPALADRPVVVKLTPCRGREHQTLARLQHTHIVPLYSARDDPVRGLRILCMPYFGGATLAAILTSLRDLPPQRRSGRHLLPPAGDAAPPRSPARTFLERASYEQAVCWLGALLAEALHYAHQRDLVHLDVKPSNVLLSADGQPMLLDFHLAREPLGAGGAAPAWLGGTPSAMSPEQQAAIAAVRRGEPIPAAVDARSDVYSLGLVLLEALGGNLTEQGRPTLRARAGLSPGLVDLVARAVDPDPARRYPTAQALADDLTRQLQDLPLRGVRNRLGERWRKWQRREPHTLAAWRGGLLMLAAAAAAVAVTLIYRGERTRWDEQRLAYERRHQAQERQWLARRLHDLADRVRARWSVEAPTPDPELEEGCRTLWERRREVLAGLEADEQVREDLLELVLLWPEAQVQSAPAGQRVERLRQALAMLDEAEGLLGPSAVLYRQRERLARELGQDALAGDSARRSARWAPRRAWEHYALGRLHFRAGELKQAAASFTAAARLQPRGLWPNFYLGVCAYRLGQHEDAVLAFTAAAARADQPVPACLYNRALAYEGWGRPQRALRDYDEALRLDPGFAPAYLNRALLRGRTGRRAEALEDLERALSHGARPAVVRYNQALLHAARGDRRAARTCLEQALAADPGHEQARAFNQRLRSGR